MKGHFFIILWLFTVNYTFGQKSQQTKTGDPKLVNILTIQPEFCADSLTLEEFIQKNLKYPQMELDNDVQGIVVVGFWVDENGSVKNPEVVKSGSKGFDKEALRLVKLLPKWEPGKSNKKPVPVYYTLNVKFAVQK